MNVWAAASYVWSCILDLANILKLAQILDKDHKSTSGFIWDERCHTMSVLIHKNRNSQEEN